MKKLVLLTLALLLFVMGMGPEERFNIREEGPTFFFGCDPAEVIEGFATWHFEGIIVNDASGGRRVQGHTNSHLEAVGLDSGAKYVGNFSDNFFEIIRDGSGVITNSFNLHLSGQGQVGDVVIKGRFHITVNANGEVTAEIDSYEEECR